MDKTLDLTIIVPLFNESESLPELVRWINRTLDGRGWGYEIIMVDDGSTDGSWKVVRELAEADGRIHGIRFRRNYGKSAALYHGFKAAGGNVVVTMDADLQDSPEEIPEMYRMVTGNSIGRTTSLPRICLPSCTMLPHVGLPAFICMT